MTDALPKIPARSRQAKPMPDRGYLHECLRYEDGRLFWRNRPEHHFRSHKAWAIALATASGRRAGSPMRNGYRLIHLDGQKYLEHRLIYHMLISPLEEQQRVDHIDHDHTNNRWQNLRACSHAENAMNQPGRPSKYGTPKGVHWSVREQKYKVAMRAGGKVHFVGTFATLEAASDAAHAARLRLHGQFANHGGVQ